MHPALLATAKVNRHTPMEQIEKAISECIQQLMKEYDSSGGQIGNEKPEDWDDARRIAYNFANQDARRHAGSKVPERNWPKPSKK